MGSRMGRELRQDTTDWNATSSSVAIEHMSKADVNEHFNAAVSLHLICVCKLSASGALLSHKYLRDRPLQTCLICKASLPPFRIPATNLLTLGFVQVLGCVFSNLVPFGKKRRFLHFLACC